MTDRRRVRELPAWVVVAATGAVMLVAVGVLVLVRSHRSTVDDSGPRTSPFPVLVAPDAIGPFTRVEGSEVAARADHATQVLDDPSNYSSLYAEYQGPDGAYLVLDAALPVTQQGLELLESAVPDTLQSYLVDHGFSSPAAFDAGDLGGYLECSTAGAAVSPGDVACGWVDQYGVAVLTIRTDGLQPAVAAEATRAVRAAVTPDGTATASVDSAG